MTSRTKEEWQEWYTERTGIKDLELLADELILFHPEHGFMALFVNDEETLYLHHLCGDGEYWSRVLREIMRQKGLKKLRAYTKRNPQAWMRKYGGRIIGYEMECGIDELKV